MERNVSPTKKIGPTKLITLANKTDTHTLISIPTNEQKKDWFLRLNPNGISSMFRKDSSSKVIKELLTENR
jgi:hypothetical protein